MVRHGEILSKSLHPHQLPAGFSDIRISTRDVLKYSMNRRPSKPGSTLKGDPKGKVFAMV